MMATIPAWKKIGLKLDDNRDNTSFSGVVHLESANVDKSLAKKLNKRKRKEEEDKKKDSKQKKPPKRVKLPKSERAPAPEKDQLAYLRQYATDKENWKFSKQKQNWILKNLDNIPHEYEDNLISYIEGIQGGARDRLVEQLTEVANQWNEVWKAIEEKVNAELYGDNNDDEKEKAEETEEKTPAVTRETAIRTKKLLHALTDDPVEFLGLDDEDTNSEAQESGTVESKSLGAPVDAGSSKKESLKNSDQEEEEKPQKEEENATGAGDEDPEESSSADKIEESEDNLIIERVEVNDYFEDSDSDSSEKRRKDSSKHKSKASREKRKLKTSAKKP